jgi:uncharacterized membrane protein YdjX (TVP38/TMEM64 family)
MQTKTKGRIITDTAMILLSIIVAFLLMKSGLIDDLLELTKNYYLLDAFIAGLFFTSAFTTAPAIAVLAKLSLTFPPLTIALIGAAGSTIGDLVIFSFVKDHVSNDVAYFLSHSKSKRVRHIFKYRFVRWSLAFLGALIIASPLPDELGLTLMGLSKMSTRRFVLISYTFNTIGILLLAYFAATI